MLIELRNCLLKSILFIALLGVLALLWAEPINLTAVDIGRHIKNGELILQGQSAVLHKNFYSFTYPDYPFLNHHWFFGVMSYILFKLIGFNGLSIVYVMVLLAAFLLFYQVARRYGGFALVMFLSALTLMAITDRREIRPEGLSVLFLGVYFYLLHCLKWRSIPAAFLFLVLLPLQLIWVNTHIFFFMGPVLVALFLWDAHLSGQDQAHQKSLRKLLIATALINVINPSGLWGMLTPFNIFKEFGYRLAENQHVFFMMNFFPQDMVYRWYLVLVAVAAIGACLAVKRDGFKTHLPFLVLMVFVAAAGIKAVRLMPFFAFFFIPLAARFYGPYAKHRVVKIALVIAAVGLVTIQFKSITKNWGIGLMPGVNASADFFKANNIKGPIFSNYDIGGYLIYHLADREKVCVVNRQEAFPPEFFNKVYIPMEQDAQVWNDQMAKYGFNVIYFYRHDLTPWGQQFMIDRINDNAWAPVFVDGYVIIFVRRGSVNQPVADRYELPKSMFTVVRPALTAGVNEAGQSK